MGVFHKDLTGANLHVPLGYSPDHLTLLAAADAMEWRDDGGNNILLVDTSADSITIGNSTTWYDITIHADVMTINLDDDLTGPGFIIKDTDNVNYLRIATGTTGIPASAGSIIIGESSINTPISFPGTGNWLVSGSAGTSGHVLTSNGSGASPTWQAAGGVLGSGINGTSWTVNQDAAAGEDEDSCIVLKSTDTAGETNSVFDMDLCLIAAAGAVTGSNAYVEMSVEDDAAIHATEFHIGKRASTVQRRASIVLNAGTGAAARTGSITLEQSGNGELEFNTFAQVKVNTRLTVRLNNNLEVDGTGNLGVGVLGPGNRIHVVDTAANNTALVLLDKNADQDSCINFRAGSTDINASLGVDQSASAFVLSFSTDLDASQRWGVDTANGVRRFKSEDTGTLFTAGASFDGHQTVKTQLTGLQTNAALWTSHTMGNGESIMAMWRITIIDSAGDNAGYAVVAGGAKRNSSGTTSLVGTGVEVARELDAALTSAGITFDVAVGTGTLKLVANQDSGTYTYFVSAMFPTTDA